MKITKYEHACLVVEEGGGRLVIDPGVYSQSFKDFDNVTAVIVSHIHPDHFDKAKIEQILAQNPGVKILSTAEVASDIGSQATSVKASEVVKVGPFSLEFFGGQHAKVHSSYPVGQNIGVMVNDTLYYGGDSFDGPGKPVAVLAVPANAPWMKMAEAMDYLADIKPKHAFPTHNHFLSDDGQGLADRLFAFSEQFGTKYQYLKPGESLEQD